MNTGDRLGQYTLVDELGSGSNAHVWRATDAQGAFVALKVLKSRNPTSEPYKRFRIEIATLTGLGRRSGVLPVLGSSLPEQPSREQRCWISMPIAMPLADAVASQTLETVVEAVATIAETLALLLQEHQISHRDIKPGNLYLFEGLPVVGDFGLADVPGAESLTAPGAQLGPAHFMAYEMLTDAGNARGEPADVFSLAKTLWVLATGQRYAPPGEQRADVPAHGIGQYRAHGRVRRLDELIERSTRTDPAARPTLAVFASDLRIWLLAPQAGGDAVDISAVAGRLREVTRSSVGEQARLDALRQLGERRAGELVERLETVMETLRNECPFVRDGVHDPLIVGLLGRRMATDPQFASRTIRVVQVDSARQRPTRLTIAYAVIVTDDGMLRLRARTQVVRVGVLGGGQDLWTPDEVVVPAESLQADHLVDSFADEIKSRLRGWLESYVEQLEREAGSR